jgi:conjugal transfer ATP-binding protein TraC
MLGLLSSKGDADQTIIAGDRKDVPWAHLTVRACDEESKVFYSASDSGEYSLGACFVGYPLLGADNGTIEKLRSALGIPFPAGSFIQIGLFAAPDVDFVLDRYMQGKERAQPEFLRNFVRERRDFLAKGVESPLVSRSGVLLNFQRLIVTMKIPCRANPDEVAIREAKEYADRIGEAIRAAGIETDMLDEKGYLALMRMFFHLYEKQDASYDDMKPIREQVFYPGDQVKYGKKQITFNDGEYHARLMSVKHFPKKTSLAVMNHMIGDPYGLSNQITDPFYMVLTLHYPDQVAKSAAVKRDYGWINHQVFGPTSHLIPILGYKKAGFDVLVHEMEGRGAVLCEANLTLVLFSRDEDRLKKLTAGLQAYYSSIAFEMREDRRITKELFNSVLPLNTTRNGIKNLYRFHTMAIRHAVQFAPILGEWRGTGMGGASVFVTRRGQPVLFDFYDSSTGYNGILFAETGAGKSFVTNRFIDDYLAEGAKIWAIDSGYSYLKNCAANDGEYITFSDESDICLNPFTHVEDIDDDMDLLKAILAKMAAPEAGLDDFRMAALEEAIKATWVRYGNHSSVTAVAEWCLSQPDIRVQDIGKQLYPFTRHGAQGRWFDGYNNLRLDKSFVVLELKELEQKKNLQRVVLLQLMTRIANEMFNTPGRRKLFIIDEGWEQLDDPVVAKALEAFYRKVRKAKGCVLVVTQNIGDFYNSANGKAIVANSAWQIILEQKSESIDAAVESKQFSMEPYGLAMMKSIHTVPGKYSELMIKRKGDWGIVRLVEHRFAQVLYSTKDSEYDAILGAMKRGVPVGEAINDFIAQEKAA